MASMETVPSRAVRTRRLAVSEGTDRPSGTAYGNPFGGTRDDAPVVPIGAPLQALTITSKLRLQGSALAAALARPDVQSALTDVSWRTGAGHVTGVSVVYGALEPQLIPVRETATGAVAEAEVVWQGSDGALDQDLEEFMPEGPQRARLDWNDLGKFAPDVDDPRATPLPADRPTLRRPGRVSSRRGFFRPPLPVDTVARIFELRNEGLSFKKIGKALGIAAWTVSRYVRSFEEGDC